MGNVLIRDRIQIQTYKFKFVQCDHAQGSKLVEANVTPLFLPVPGSRRPPKLRRGSAVDRQKTHPK